VSGFSVALPAGHDFGWRSGTDGVVPGLDLVHGVQRGLQGERGEDL
jgi:hypothetical protein